MLAPPRPHHSLNRTARRRRSRAVRSAPVGARIRHMKGEPLVAAVTVVAVAVSLNPPGLTNGGDVGTSEIRPSEAWHHDHIELEPIELATATCTERELRPLAPRPFNTSAMFGNPITRNWQTPNDALGSPLPLLAS